MAVSREAPCPLHSECGGCKVMRWSEEVQLADKAKTVSRLLDHPVSRAHPSPRALGYRARISMKSNAQGRLGYYQPRSHHWVHIPVCAIARPEINAVLERLPALPGIPAVELRSDGTRVVLAAATRLPGGKGPGKKGTKNARSQLAGLDLETLGLSGICLDGKKLQGDPHLQLEVCGIRHRLSVGSFFQVNLEVNQLLVQAVVDTVIASEPAGVLDLYAGAGNLSLPLSARGIPTVLVEQAPSSVADAQATIRSYQLSARIRKGDAGRFEAGDAFFDVALLDPPRAGAANLLPELLLTRPRIILYVSCNPRTLARDIAPAREAGYRIDKLEVFDMFPQTDHVETLCVLLRG